jgi:phosphoglycolate phosphatase/pyrophosphatase PpaX
MRFPCLVLDHDDTVVNSTATVHFPSFLAYLKLRRPDAHYTLDEYFRKNFDPGVVSLFRDELGLSDAEMAEEQDFWNEYVQHHIPQVYDGMAEILWAHKRSGGILCVVSHSFSANIRRDYRHNGLPEPDMVFGWDDPPEHRKPSTYPLETIMVQYGLAHEQLLVLDDLKPGFDMASRCGVPFAAAGWANDIPEIERFMRRNSPYYFKTVAEFGEFLAL